MTLKTVVQYSKPQFHDDQLVLSPPGAKIQILYRSKTTNEPKSAIISVGPKTNLYFALFTEDDVDFEIVFDNTASKDRSLCVELELLGKTHSFVIRKNSRGILQTIESNGRKFHFIRQSSEDGEALVSTVAALHRMTFEEASVMISRIKFTTKYSKKIQPMGRIVRDCVVVDGGHHPMRNVIKDEEEIERGAICFGERCSQQFSKMAFDMDPTIVIEPFVIEMRMKSRFCI